MPKGARYALLALLFLLTMGLSLSFAESWPYAQSAASVDKTVKAQVNALLKGEAAPSAAQEEAPAQTTADTAAVEPLKPEETTVKDLYMEGLYAPATYTLPYAVMVDRENQIVTVLERSKTTGVYSVVVDQFICSTGASRSWTPEGYHTLVRSTRMEWRYFPSSSCYIRYAVRIHGDYFFHSILYNERDLNSLSVKSYRALGSMASHGCIRMLDEDVHWLSDHCPKDTLIWIMDGRRDDALHDSLVPSKYISLTQRDFGKYDRLDDRFGSTPKP